MPRELTQKRKNFALEYLIDMCAKDAAIRAGYSPKTAKEIGCMLLKDERVQKIIHTELDKRKRRLDLSADRVLEEMAAVAFGRIDDIIDWEGDDVDIKAKEDIPAHALASISEVRRRSDKEGKVDLHLKMHSKLKALDLLGRYMDLWAGTRNVEVNVIDGQQLQKQLLERLNRVVDAEIVDKKELPPAE